MVNLTKEELMSIKNKEQEIAKVKDAPITEPVVEAPKTAKPSKAKTVTEDKVVKEGALDRTPEDVETLEQKVERENVEAMQKAAATAAMKAALETNSELAQREADKKYITLKRQYMLSKCKSDRVIKWKPSKIYAQYLGEKYTFLYNTIPVTVVFDGTEQEFPEFVYNRIQEKLVEISESNTNVVDIEERI